MEPENPIIDEYRKRLADEIERLRSFIKDLKREYSLSALERLRRELEKLAKSSGKFGYLNASKLCQDLELDLIAKIKNFSLEKAQSDWFKTLDEFVPQLEKAFSEKEIMTKKDLTKSKKNTVLIIDDDEDLLHLLTYEFHQLGFEVKSFVRGEEALNFLLNEENCKDLFLIILDRILPDMDGLDILRAFYKKFPNKTPVLITSVLSTEKDIVTGLQTGAIDYITKPFSIYMLMQKALNLVKMQTGE